MPQKEGKSGRKGAKKQQHPTTTFKKLFKSVDRGCIILLSVEPVKPLLWVSLTGVTYLGRRSFLLISRAAKGSVSSRPKGCWSTLRRGSRYPGEHAQIAPRIFRHGFPCPLRRRSAAFSGRPFSVPQNDRQLCAPAHARRSPITCARSPRSLCCNLAAVAGAPCTTAAGHRNARQIQPINLYARTVFMTGR